MVCSRYSFLQIGFNACCYLKLVAFSFGDRISEHIFQCHCTCRHPCNRKIISCLCVFFFDSNFDETRRSRHEGFCATRRAIVLRHSADSSTIPFKNLAYALPNHYVLARFLHVVTSQLARVLVGAARRSDVSVARAWPPARHRKVTTAP